MSQPVTRSLCVALGRLRFAVVTSCWIIALSLVAQLVVWSLTSFTELRYGDPSESADIPLIVDGNQKDTPKSKPVAAGGREDVRWRPEDPEAEEEGPPLGRFDRVFKIVVTVARTAGLMGAIVTCPLLMLGVILAVPTSAPKVERAVNALIWAIVLVLLAMPLGGWFGLAWQAGTFSDYDQMMVAVEAARAAETGFGPAFYARFLLLPAASVVGFVLVSFHFSSAVDAVLIKGDPGLDPALDREASNVAATSLHGTGRTAGALTRALEDDKKKKRKKMESLSKVSPGEMPKRLI